MTDLIGQSHVIVVPTRTEFEEGFNMVCAESALSFRPLVTSPVCPALRYVQGCAIEVTPNSVDGYYEAILELSRNESLYVKKIEACVREREQFFDLSRSYGARLKKAIRRVTPGSLGRNTS